MKKKDKAPKGSDRVDVYAKPAKETKDSKRQTKALEKLEDKLMSFSEKRKAKEKAKAKAKARKSKK